MEKKKFRFTLHCIVPGGKNHIGITRTGKRYPMKSWALWRDQVVSELREILKPTQDTMITLPCRMDVSYTAGDLRKRDLTAMCDSVFHCLERAGLIEDDSLIRNLHWTNYGYDKKNPSCIVSLEEL